jgi:hypothetical protein
MNAPKQNPPPAPRPAPDPVYVPNSPLDRTHEAVSLSVELPPRWRLVLEWLESAFWSAKKRQTYLREVQETRDYFDQLEAHEQRLAQAADVGGRHFTAWIDTVKELKRASRYVEAEALLVQLCEAAEAWAAAYGLEDAPPWYADQLRIVRKKRAAQTATK